MTTITDLFVDMLHRGTDAARKPVLEPMETVSSTVRFGGELRRFLELQAEAMGGVSVQSVITAVLTGVMQQTLRGYVDPVRIVPERILRLLDLHAIDRITGAEILGVPFADMTPERLVGHIDNDLVDRISQTFAVSRAWFLGHSDVPRGADGSNGLSKSPSTAAKYMMELARAGLAPTFHFVKGRWDLRQAAEQDNSGFHVAMFISMNRKTPSGRPYKTFEHWSTEPWAYQRTRLEMLALVRFFTKMLHGSYDQRASDLGFKPWEFRHFRDGFSYGDHQFSNEDFGQISGGATAISQAFLGYDLTRFGVQYFQSLGWASLEDYVLSPEESACSKADPTELEYVREKCDEIIKFVGEIIHTERAEQEADEAEAAEQKTMGEG